MTRALAFPAGTRRRRLKRAGVCAAIVLAALAVVVWRFSWWAPPVYLPGPGAGISGIKLESADHDVRYRQVAKTGYLLHVVAGGAGSRGSLLFFGALHSKDPDHPQLETLVRAWTAFKPTVALVEGRMSFFVGTASQGVRVFGEGAMVYSLAQEAGIPLYTLEPPLEVEIEALEECGDRTQVAMFRVLSGYISARRGGAVSDFKMRRLLRNRADMLTDAFPDIAAFDAYVSAQLPGMPHWRELPEDAMWPGKTDTLLHRMATRSNTARDEHFVRVMLDLVRRGERVIAIAGRSHALVLEPMLWESLQPAERGELSSPRPWESP